MYYYGPRPTVNYDRPAEYGGLLSVHPRIRTYHGPMSAEQHVAWAQAARMCSTYDQPMNGYFGDVTSIQLTAKPGYYVSPEVMAELGWEGNEVPPNG